MISGYVIFYSSKNRTASSFAVARLLRLYSAFLCGLFLTSAVVVLWGGGENTIYLSQFLFNLSMVPKWFDRNGVDGSYWTFALEIQFYALIFVLILCRVEKKIELFFMVWPVLILIAYFAGGKNWILLGGYFSYFSAGASFAMKRSKNSRIVDCLLLLCLFESIQFSVLRIFQRPNLHSFRR